MVGLSDPEFSDPASLADWSNSDVFLSKTLDPLSLSQLRSLNNGRRKSASWSLEKKNAKGVLPVQPAVYNPQTGSSNSLGNQDKLWQKKEKGFLRFAGPLSFSLISD